MEIDIGPILEQIILAAAACLSVAAVYLTKLFKDWLKASLAAANIKVDVDELLKDDVIRSYLDTALDMGVKYGVNSLNNADWTKIETKNAATAAAANYVLSKVPEALDHFNIDEEGLKSRLEARLLDHDQAPGIWKDAAEVEAEATAPMLDNERK